MSNGSFPVLWTTEDVAHCVSSLHESRSSVAGMKALEFNAFVGNLCCASGEKLDSVISLCPIISSEYTPTLGTRWHC